jgi:hypothetical protein
LFWNELTPRMRMVLRPPGEPLFSTRTPETAASSRCSTLADVCRSAASRFTLATAPVMLPRSCSSEYAVTTTCSRSARRSMRTSTVVRPLTASCTGRWPMRVKLSVPFAGAVIV